MEIDSDICCFAMASPFISVPFTAFSVMFLLLFNEMYNITEATGLITDSIIYDNYSPQYSNLVLKISHPIINHTLDENYQSLIEHINVNKDQVDQYQVGQEIKFWYSDCGVIWWREPVFGVGLWVVAFYGFGIAATVIIMLTFSVYVGIFSIIKYLNNTIAEYSTVSSKNSDDWEVILKKQE